MAFGQGDDIADLEEQVRDLKRDLRKLKRERNSVTKERDKIRKRSEALFAALKEMVDLNGCAGHQLAYKFIPEFRPDGK